MESYLFLEKDSMAATLLLATCLSPIICLILVFFNHLGPIAIPGDLGTWIFLPIAPVLRLGHLAKKMKFRRRQPNLSEDRRFCRAGSSSCFPVL